VAERLASLPMYDLPAIRQVTDSWWTGLRKHFRYAGVHGVPQHLSRPGEGQEFWLRPDLLFSQCCGYPLVTRLGDEVALLGTPCYDTDGCHGSDYRSFVIVRDDCPADSIADLRGGRCAINMAESWSGHHALRLVTAQLIDGGRPAFEILESGSHGASIDAVRAGAADFAAIDCVLFGLLSRYTPERIESLRILTRTPSMPALPLIAGGAVSDDEIRRIKEALRAAFDDPALHLARQRLLLDGICFTPTAEYRRLLSALDWLQEQGVPPFL